MNPFKPGIVEQSDPRRVKKSLSVPECCAQCDECEVRPIGAHGCRHHHRDIDSDIHRCRPIWCIYNTSFVRA